LEHKKNWKTYLIGRLGDVELHMLHYHDEHEARIKWNNRVKRVNMNHIIYKFNDQNGATQAQIKSFLELPLEHKLCFVAKPEMKVDNRVILVKQPEDERTGIKASREPFGKSKYIDLTAYINNIGESNE
jgi:uncharacterized protein (DUF1919 family)